MRAQGGTGGSSGRGALALLVLLLAAGCARDATLYTQDGVRRASGQRGRLDGREEGEWSYWYPSGELREQGRFEDGRRMGDWTQWYPSGQRREQGERRWDRDRRRSEREGVWIFWHENGMEAARGVFRGGLREGRWEYTNRDGGLDGVLSGEYHQDVKLDGAR